MKQKIAGAILCVFAVVVIGGLGLFAAAILGLMLWSAAVRHEPAAIFGLGAIGFIGSVIWAILVYEDEGQ